MKIKLKIKKIISATAAAVMLVSALMPASLPVSSASLQEQSWLSHLRPSNLPGDKVKDSYPVELKVSVAGQQEITLKGTCSLEGKLTDDDILDAMKKAAAEVDGYKSPENAVEDKLKIDKLQKKVTFGKEEQERIVKNWLSLVGMDKVADLLGGKLPSYGEADTIGAVVDFISEGKLPGAGSLVPVPTDVSGFSQGLVINGVLLSIDQYKRDQEKYKDIVELAAARARFREFNGVMNRILKEMAREKTAWTIRIEDQVTKDQLYRGAPEIYAPYIYTADIVLVKKDGGYENPVGAYQGRFVIDIDVSLLDYDRNFAKYLAESYNKKLREMPGYINESMMWKVVSQSANRTSENKTTLEGKKVYVTLADSLGGVFEMKLNPYALDIAYSRVLHDFVSVITQKGEAATATQTWTEITDSEAGTAYVQVYDRVVDILGNVSENTSTDDDPYPAVDPRSYLGLTLVVDMAG